MFGDFKKIHGGPEQAPITDDDSVTLGENTTILCEIYKTRIILNPKAEQSLPKATLKLETQNFLS